MLVMLKSIDEQVRTLTSRDKICNTKIIQFWASGRSRMAWATCVILSFIMCRAFNYYPEHHVLCYHL